VENQNSTQTERDLRAICRFFNHKIPKYIFIVLDDERFLNYLIVRVQIELKKKKKEILRFQLNESDAYAFRQVKTFLKENPCAGLVVTNLNMLIYKYDHECIDLLNKSRDAFARFHLPIVFVINTDNLKKIINGASDFYQLRELPDFHFEGSGVEERDVLNISFQEFDQIKDSDLKASLLEEQLKIVIKKQKVDKNALNNIVVPLLSIYIEKNDFKKVEELFDSYIKGKEELVKDKIVLGDCYYQMFDFKKAIYNYQQALDDYRELKDRSQILRCYLRLGDSYYEIGSYDEARSCYEKSLAIGRDLGDNNGIAASLHKIGRIYHEKGRYDEALRHYQQSLEIRKKIGDIKGVSYSLHQVGLIYQEKGDYDTALKQYEKSIEIKEKIGDIKGVSYSLYQVGNVYYLKGDYDAALRQYEKAMETFERIGDIKGVSSSLHQIGMLYHEKGDYEAALKQYEKAKETFEKIGDIKGVSSSLHQVGMIYQEKGDYDAALEKFKKALEIFEEIGDIAGKAGSMNQIGLIHKEKKDYTAALKLFSKSLQIYSKIGSPMVDIVKDNIDHIREKMPKEEFEAIAKEFGILDNWFKKEPDS
jgi:tetratricopeptide (TPR) repeat protein